MLQLLLLLLLILERVLLSVLMRLHVLVHILLQPTVMVLKMLLLLLLLIGRQSGSRVRLSEVLLPMGILCRSEIHVTRDLHYCTTRAASSTQQETLFRGKTNGG